MTRPVVRLVMQGYLVVYGPLQPPMEDPYRCRRSSGRGGERRGDRKVVSRHRWSWCPHRSRAHRADASKGKASRQHIGRSCGASRLAVSPQIRSGDCCNAVGGARRAAIGLLSHPSSRCEQKPAARGVHGVHAVDHGQDVHEKGPRYGRSNPKRPASPDESCAPAE